ncbi:MAG: hypothetical protein AAF846_23645 [Chloroflexota bacterium]
MKQWTEEDIEYYLEILERNDPNDLANLFFVILQFNRIPPHPVPTGNTNIITGLEKLLEDRRLWTDLHHNIILEEVYGEMRWLAARVLACEYAYQGIETPIVLKDVIQPINSSEIDRISDDKSASLTELVERGLIPRKTETIKPQDYYECSSKEAIAERIRK